MFVNYVNVICVFFNVGILINSHIHHVHECRSLDRSGSCNCSYDHRLKAFRLTCKRRYYRSITQQHWNNLLQYLQTGEREIVEIVIAGRDRLLNLPQNENSTVWQEQDSARYCSSDTTDWQGSERGGIYPGTDIGSESSMPSPIQCSSLEDFIITGRESESERYGKNMAKEILEKLPPTPNSLLEEFDCVRNNPKFQKLHWEPNLKKTVIVTGKHWMEIGRAHV